MKIIFKKNKASSPPSKAPQKSIRGAKDFEQFYHSSVRKLIHIAYQIVGDKNTAEGIVHEVLTDIWERRKEIVINVSLEAYAIQAAKFKSFDHLKERVKNEHLKQQILSLRQDSHNDVEEAVAGRDLQTKVNHLTSLLPKRCKEVFHLSRVKSMSNREIDMGLQISEKAVEKHITKAIKHLRIGLEKS